MGRRGGNRRKLAETPCRNFAREIVRIFPVSLLGSTTFRQLAIHLRKLRELQESAGCRLTRNSGCRRAVTNVSATKVIFVRFFKTLACPAQSSSGAAPGVIALSHHRNKTVTRGSYGIGASGFHEGGPYEFRK